VQQILLGAAGTVRCGRYRLVRQVLLGAAHFGPYVILSINEVLVRVFDISMQVSSRDFYKNIPSVSSFVPTDSVGAALCVGAIIDI